MIRKAKTPVQGLQQFKLN